MTYDIYTKALDMLKKRELYHGAEAEKATSYAVKCAHLDKAGAYNSAWWILYYAIHENWECLDQFDYIDFGEENTDENLA